MGGRNGQRSIGGVSVHVNIYSLSSQYRGRRRRRGSGEEQEKNKKAANRGGGGKMQEMRAD